MINFDFISIKSRFCVEYRRYALDYGDVLNFEQFYNKIKEFHKLYNIPFDIYYSDSENFSLPINNDDNLAKAINSTQHIYLTTLRNQNNNYYPALIRRPYLRLNIKKKAEDLESSNGTKKGPRPSIGVPQDFRIVSSIIDVDTVPKTCRRVRIAKHGSDKPLGFYICDGTYKRMNAQTGQIELVTGVFISRLLPGGLAESTGLLSVNDEVLEVNGIPVTQGKTLDQVTDMMVANSSNLIMTIRPGRMTYAS